MAVDGRKEGDARPESGEQIPDTVDLSDILSKRCNALRPGRSRARFVEEGHFKKHIQESW